MYTHYDLKGKKFKRGISIREQGLIDNASSVIGAAIVIILGSFIVAMFIADIFFTG